MRLDAFTDGEGMLKALGVNATQGIRGPGGMAFKINFGGARTEGVQLRIIIHGAGGGGRIGCIGSWGSLGVVGRLQSFFALGHGLVPIRIIDHLDRRGVGGVLFRAGRTPSSSEAARR